MSVTNIKKGNYEYYCSLVGRKQSVNSNTYYQVIQSLLTHSLVLQKQVNATNEVLTKVNESIEIVKALHEEGKI
jgi:hypothetical protein|tara:strand:- start:555 stop:776 length:222 start_codon:yes stop_codon:yes gene_type:complete